MTGIWNPNPIKHQLHPKKIHQMQDAVTTTMKYVAWASKATNF
jgi:hypothetical protein